MKQDIIHRKILFEKLEKTIIKWLSDYDNGIIVNTVSMGGFGDGYELALQECAIEAMRNLQGIDVPEENEKFVEILNTAVDKAANKLDDEHGFSGAQVGAAKNIAAVFWKQTPERAIKMLPDEERILKMQKDEYGMAKIIRE